MKGIPLLSILFLFLPFHSLDAKDSISAYLFLLDDCVICQDYTPILNDLYEEYKNDVSFIGVFPNFSSKSHKIDAFREKYKIEFPLKTDYFKSLSHQFQATVTPEVVVFNHTTNTLLYQGRIDNKFVKIGKRRQVITSNEFQLVLEAIANGRSVNIEKTIPIGCFINYGDPISKYQLIK